MLTNLNVRFRIRLVERPHEDGGRFSGRTAKRPTDGGLTVILRRTCIKRFVLYKGLPSRTQEFSNLRRQVLTL
jgi:hypothetical protein